MLSSEKLKRRAKVGIATRVVAVVVVVILIIVAAAGYYALTRSTSSTMSSTTTSTSTTSTVPSSSSQTISTTLSTPTSGTSLTKINYIMAFIPTAVQDQYYVGQAEGFYAMNGISVNLISNPSGSAGAVKAVAAGQADMGESDLGTFLLTAYTNNITNVVAVGLFYHDSQFGVIYLQGGSIHSLSDLNGKTVAESAGNAATLLWPAFAAINHINVSSINFVTTTAANLVSAVQDHQVDASLGSILGGVQITALTANTSSPETGANFAYKDFGLDTLGTFVIVNTAFLQAHPSAVKGFMTALGESIQFAMKNPQKAAQDESTLAGVCTCITVPWLSYANNESLLGNPTQILAMTNPDSVGWVNQTSLYYVAGVISSSYGIPEPNLGALYNGQFVTAPS